MSLAQLHCSTNGFNISNWYFSKYKMCPQGWFLQIQSQIHYNFIDYHSILLEILSNFMEMYVLGNTTSVPNFVDLLFGAKKKTMKI